MNNINIDEKYAIIVNDILQYIEKIKSKDKNAALIDIIMDFSLKKDISVDVIGDAIANDIYFKSFIEKDLNFHDPKNETEEW